MKSNRFAFSLVILVTLFLGSSAFATYRGELTGSTPIEREIKWLWRYIPQFVTSCGASGSECKDPKIQAVLQKLVNYAPAWNSAKQAEWADLLVFVSEKTHPELFTVANGKNEVHRLAVTELKPYSKVYINTDRMDLPLETWVGILTHEVVHHLGIADDDQRFPDMVGVEVAKHFKKQIQTSTLAQFKLPQTRTLVFNSVAENTTTISFVNNGTRTGDFGWEPDGLHPLCQPDEQAIRQYASAPAWSVNRMDIPTGRVVVRGGGFVQTICKHKVTGQQRGTTYPINAAFGLQYSVPLKLERWTEETPTPTYTQEDVFAPSVNPNDAMFGQAQTFWIESVQQNQETYAAGDVWTTTYVLKSLDDFKPTKCTLFLAGTQYSFIGQDHLPGIQYFEKCEFKSLGQGRWQVTGTTRLPDSIRPDLYYVPMIVMNADKLGDRTAVPTIPSFIQVANKTAPPAPVIRGIQIRGGKPAANLGSLPLTNSVMVPANGVVKVEFIAEGIPKAYDLWVDIDIWHLLATEFGIARGTGSSTSFGQVLRNEIVTPVSSGTKVSFELQMVTGLSGLQIAGFKIRKLYMRTTDYSWVEIELPGLHDHMIVNEKYTKPW